MSPHDRLVTDGYTNIIPQVRFKNSEGREFIADFVAQGPDGKLVFVDAKTGPGAKVTHNQDVGYPELASSGAVVIDSRLARFNMPMGATVTMQPELDHWECPICGK